MRFGKLGTITPTDVDGLIEYEDKCYILFEIKLGDAHMPKGQELAFTRLIDNLKKPGVLFQASHDIEDAALDVDVSVCIVKRYYWQECWHELTNGVTLKKATEQFIKKFNSEL